MQEVSQSTSVKRSGDYVRRGGKKKAAQLSLCFSTGWENPQLNQKHRTCNHQGREKIARNTSKGNWFLLQSSIFLPSLPSSSKYIYIYLYSSSLQLVKSPSRAGSHDLACTVPFGLRTPARKVSSQKAKKEPIWNQTLHPKKQHQSNSTSEHQSLSISCWVKRLLSHFAPRWY